MTKLHNIAIEEVKPFLLLKGNVPIGGRACRYCAHMKPYGDEGSMRCEKDEKHEGEICKFFVHATVEAVYELALLILKDKKHLTRRGVYICYRNGAMLWIETKGIALSRFMNIIPNTFRDTTPVVVVP